MASRQCMLAMELKYWKENFDGLIANRQNFPVKILRNTLQAYRNLENFHAKNFHAINFNFHGSRGYPQKYLTRIFISL